MFENETLEFDRETGEVLSEKEEINALLGAVSSPKKRVKRTEAQMVADLGGSALKEAIYVLDRAQKLEEKIAELMAAISDKGRERVIEESPHLSRYLP